MKHIRVDHLIKPGPGAEYIVGIRPSDGKRAPEDLSSGEVAAEAMAHPEWTTKSAAVQRCLAWLALEFERCAP